MMTMRQSCTAECIGRHFSQSCQCLMVSPLSGDHFCSSLGKMAKIDRWREKEDNSLLACLRGKAITYIKTEYNYQSRSYESLKCLLEQRNGMTGLPVTSRRQLSSMNQEGKTLGDFAGGILMCKTGKATWLYRKKTLVLHDRLKFWDMASPFALWGLEKGAEMDDAGERLEFNRWRREVGGRRA